mmetsp:Transcript_9943/g.26470  ORF Transcript_9943/g.26470 Transcript_9943/m.26470 type:complete len:511 (+) Transcript_9943:135-1667(+)
MVAFCGPLCAPNGIARGAVQSRELRTPAFGACPARTARNARVIAPLLAKAEGGAATAAAGSQSGAALKQEYKYVVVGGGVAAGYAAKEFVERGVSPDSVLIVSRETVAPYERPALSKAFLFKDPPVRLPGFHTCVGGGGERQAPEWYDEKGIKLALGESVEKLDAQSKTITLKSGATVTATDALIVATGASAIRLNSLPGAQLEGVHCLREHDEGLALHAALKAAAESGGKVVCLGGGYIGMEVAAAARMMGADVTMVFPDDHFMPRLFTPELAARYEQKYLDKGVKIVKHCSGAAFNAAADAPGRVGSITLSGASEETLKAAVVVVGVGARPEVALLDGQVEMDSGKGGAGGVRVDQNMQTSAPGVYAVGDIAAFELALYGDGRRVRMEHVQHARLSAACAVRAALGAPEAYEYVPYFYSRVFDLSWQFFGDAPAGAECVLLGDMNPKLLAAWVLDGRVTGVFMESPSDEDSAVLRSVAVARPTVSAKDIAGAGDPDAALSMLKSSSTT